jgi:predicted AAA+ superfamily ATPase
MSGLKPWREIAIPHSDVLEGTFQQSEFAADLSAVQDGKASVEYQDAKAFYQRTFITEGMSLLLTSVANRLNKKGGDPVIQLQTSFGGGKTHTMLAVYHLASRTCPIQDLLGVGQILDQAGLMDVPKAKVVVLDGNELAPSQPRLHGTTTVKTLWGELAWQLGGEALFEKIKDSDIQGTSPGKDLLQRILEESAPCVILVDELVAYIRQFEPNKTFSGGTFDSNLSFVQALTEAIKLVPDALMLASLPESEVEAGSAHGLFALKSLEKTFGRVQALWKPVATEEAFEIVRRRLFETVADVSGRDSVCSAFAEAYRTAGAGIPSETQEFSYLTRLTQAYPIHPEVFARLYEDWSTLQGFQRTRGVLKLMAKIIHQLWKDTNRDLMILPGSFPLYDISCRAELTQHLTPGWEPVIERDVDGPRSETVGLESKEPRFGSIEAARRVARTLFLGTAPSSGETKQGIRGLDRGRVLLGCLQPGQAPAIYVDALGRLVERLHYLSATGDKALETTRYWFDTRANLRREMEDRKARFDDRKEVRERVALELRGMVAGSNLFDGVHVFTPHSDVPDDTALRLILLPPNKLFSNAEKKIAFEEVKEYLKNNGTRPRHRANRLIFVAPDEAVYPRMVEQSRIVLAWESILEDIETRKLNVDGLQLDQAKKALAQAKSGLIGTYRECYKWLLCPVQETPTEREVTIESFPISTSGTSFNQAVEQVCKDNELVITEWAATHLKKSLTGLYWKAQENSVTVTRFWEDSTKYLFLPRLKTIGVLNQAVQRGAKSRDFFGTALEREGERWIGFQFGTELPTVDSNLILIEPGEAVRYEAVLARELENAIPKQPTVEPKQQVPGLKKDDFVVPPVVPQVDTKKTFTGSVNVAQASFKMRLQDIANEILVHLASDPNVELEITLEISATFPKGVTTGIQRTVSENATSLGFTVKEWE